MHDFYRLNSVYIYIQEKTREPLTFSALYPLVIIWLYSVHSLDLGYFPPLSNDKVEQLLLILHLYVSMPKMSFCRDGVYPNIVHTAF